MTFWHRAAKSAHPIGIGGKMAKTIRNSATVVCPAETTNPLIDAIEELVICGKPERTKHCQRVDELLNSCCERWRDSILLGTEKLIRESLSSLRKHRRVSNAKQTLEQACEDIRIRVGELDSNLAAEILSWFATVLGAMRAIRFVSQGMNGASLQVLTERSEQALTHTRELLSSVPPTTFHRWHELAIYVGAMSKPDDGVMHTGFSNRTETLVWEIPIVRDGYTHVIQCSDGRRFDFEQTRRDLIDEVIVSLERIGVQEQGRFDSNAMCESVTKVTDSVGSTNEHANISRFVFALEHHNPDCRDLAVEMNKASDDPDDSRSKNQVAKDFLSHLDGKGAVKMLQRIRKYERDKQKR